MKHEYRNLRLNQLSAALDAFHKARHIPRPSRGWLRAVREALGLTQQQVADTVRVTRETLKDFEAAEADETIALRNLRRVAEAMGCGLVYAVVPKSGSFEDLAEQQARKEATKRVLAVERTMALEGQAPGGVKDLIDKETKRILKNS